jgi:hypothetical protein
MFTKCLFGLDKAKNDEEILNGINQYLSPIYNENGVEFMWELAFYSVKLNNY